MPTVKELFGDGMLIYPSSKLKSKKSLNVNIGVNAAFKLQSGVTQSAYLLGILFPGVIVFAAQALVLLALAVALGVRYSITAR